MAARANYSLTLHISDPPVIIIRDEGGDGPSVTNDAEAVVIEALQRIQRRVILACDTVPRLVYRDSDGRWDGLGTRHGRFTHFIPLGGHTEEEAVRKATSMSALAWGAEAPEG